MIELTQTDVDHGNCWQTAVACVLEADPASMPDQVALEKAGSSYLNALNAWLERHHGLMYSELHDYQFGALSVRDPGWHFLVGPSVRTPEKGRHHVVVARYGAMAWDPHPSRAGLVEVEKWGLVAPVPERVSRFRRERLDTDWGRKELVCRCPDCLRERISEG